VAAPHQKSEGKVFFKLLTFGVDFDDFFDANKSGIPAPKVRAAVARALFVKNERRESDEDFSIKLF
jgi:hypothetical protein